MKPINTALCSFGMSGWVFHAPFISIHPGFNLYAVWERTKNLAGDKYPGTKTFRTLEEMLADENIELVIINTPSVTHYEYAKQAMLDHFYMYIRKNDCHFQTSFLNCQIEPRLNNMKCSVFYHFYGTMYIHHRACYYYYHICLKN